MKSSGHTRARSPARADAGPLSLGLAVHGPAAQARGTRSGLERSDARPPRATMLAVVFDEASRSGLRFSSPSPLPGGIRFAVQPLACSHAHALSAHCHGRPRLRSPLQD